MSHFTYQEEAQDFYEQFEGNPHRLDADNNGIACKELPSRDENGGSNGGSGQPGDGSDPGTESGNNGNGSSGDGTLMEAMMESRTARVPTQEMRPKRTATFSW